jgi:iduronate 2-sulfatase
MSPAQLTVFLFFIITSTLPAAERRNVLLLVSDDCRASMGCLGGPALTPHIDQLAREGFSFQRTYCQYALCNPSRASFLTGLRPDTTQVYDNATQFRQNVPNVVTLPQLFKQLDYTVARIGKLYHYDVPKQIGTNGLDDPQSWELIWNPRGRDCDDEDEIYSILAGQGQNPATIQKGTRNYGATLSWLAAEGTDSEQTDGKIAAQAVKFLQEKHAKPFFLAVGFFRPHTPYVAPKHYFELYPRAQISLPQEPLGNRETKPKGALMSTPQANYGMDTEVQRTVKQAYLASTSFMDAQFGLVLAELEKQGLAKNTVVIFLSDHGYHLGEHGLWQKRSLFEESTRVPLIIRAPGLQPGSTQSITELVDLYPTVTELCGVTAPAQLEGRSLCSIMAQPNTHVTRAAFTQVRYENKKSGVTIGRSVRTDDYRYTEWNMGKDGVELYDHRQDQQELHNLAADSHFSEVCKVLHLLLLKQSN